MKKLFTTFLFLSCFGLKAAFAQDLAVTSVISPVSGCNLACPADLTVQVTNNAATGAEGGYYIEYNYTYSDGCSAPVPFVGGYDLDTDDVFLGTPDTHTFADQINICATGIYVVTVTVYWPGDLNANNTLVYTLYNYGPSIAVTPSTPYFQTFETGCPNWFANGTNSSWTRGTPNKSVIIGSYAGGVNSWVTGLTSTHNANEASMLNSPCFDLTTMVDPVIEMAVWWSSNIQDGAVLQASTNGGTNWFRVGNFNDSVNWYNRSDIIALNTPTGQQHGWAGLGGSSSGGWITVRHDLKNANTGLTLGGQNNVKLRIVFASNGSGNADGIAIDNVLIRDKPPLDVVLLNYEPFSQGCGLGTNEHITINFFNNGTTPLVAGPNFKLSYTIGSNPAVVEDYSGPTVAPFTMGSYTFTASQNFTTATQFPIAMELILPGDVDPTTNTKTNIIYNSVVPPNYVVNFEAGVPALSQFSMTTRPNSRILVNSTAAYQGNFGMIMDGSATALGWSDFDALTNPWGPNSNPDRYSQAVLCAQTPQNLDSLSLSFYLKQLYNENFLWTNFRLTVNGQAIPFKVNGTPFVPAGNNQALRPPVTFTPGVTNTWQLIEADLTPYLDTANISMQIAFESNVRQTYDFTATAGTANLLDSITLVGSFINCATTPYHFTCPCGPILFDSVTCCPDPLNPLCITGRANLVEPTLVQVYPNPTEGEVAVDLSAIKPGQYTIEVMDVTGKSTRKESVMVQNQPNYTINLSKEPRGIYFIKISSETNVYLGKVALQ